MVLKRKEGYSPDIKLLTDFQELLNGNFGDMCSFLYALHPVISSKRWNILTDYPMGMPVMKGGSSQFCVWFEQTEIHGRRKQYGRKKEKKGIILTSNSQQTSKNY